MQTIPGFFEENVNKFSDNIFLLEKTGAAYQGSTYQQVPVSDAGIHEAIRCIGHELNHYRKLGHYGNMFPHRWLPAAIGILPAPFSEDNHMINTAMKMVRGKITDTYKSLIDFLYTSEGKDSYHKKNMEMRDFLGK